VGAGITGTVFARTLAEADKKVLVVEKRNHIGGNCFDTLDNAGVMVHKYGAHIFHTDFEDVWEYLSRFTEWRPYQHEVLCHVDGTHIPIPFNFYSLKAAFDGQAVKFQDLLTREYGEKSKLSVLTILDSDDPDILEIGQFIYEKIFKNYTLKQWGLNPSEISPEVLARVPVYTDYDNRYFTDTYQRIPKDGYTAMFDKMLSHPNIDVKLRSPFESVGGFNDGKITVNNNPFEGICIYTGPVDTLFSCRFGPLPYRSLRFEFETLQQEYYQSKAVINFPNDHAYTRIIESKHMTGQQCPKTTICREYPLPHVPDENEPYYPLSTDHARQQYELYAAEAGKYDNLILAGRLAEFRYYDMDDAAKNALDIARILIS
jgi:UDP-galactopyranose mutase